MIEFRDGAGDASNEESEAHAVPEVPGPPAPERPSFILSARDVPEEPGQYPGTTEILSHGRAIGAAAGLQRIGLHVERLEPGHRSSLPHAHEDEEEFVYVLEGEVEAWVDGHLHHMIAGDLAAFPAGTGIAHTVLNSGTREALLLVGGERSTGAGRLAYPLNPERVARMAAGRRWEDAPTRPLGNASPHPAQRFHAGSEASPPATPRDVAHGSLPSRTDPDRDTR